MTKEKMTVQQGLVQLKLLDKRITKKNREAQFIGIREKDVTTGENAAEDYQSIVDMIRRRDAIKKAIVLSNATTVVKIAGEEMTVAEAIERKNSISYSQDLLEHMRQDYNYVMREYERKIERRDEQISSFVATQTQSRRVDEKEVKELAEAFQKANPIEIYDPLGLEEQIKQLDEYIDTFLSDVDLILSESNIRTEIEIEY